MDVSIIIVNYNGKNITENCLNSIFSLKEKVEKEVIVVDNGSNDGSVEYLKERFPQVFFIENKKNIGFAKGNNLGIKKSRGKYVVLLNNDTEVLNKAFERAYYFMEKNKDVGICGFKLLNPDGSIQYSCRDFPSFETALFNRTSLFTRIFPNNPFSQKYLKTHFSHDKVIEVDWVSGAAMMIRKSTLDEIGLLDEDYFMYSEDVDICYRCWQIGKKVVYYPESKVIHYIGTTTKYNPRLRIPVLWHRHYSMYLFYKKHYSRDYFLLDFITIFIIFLRFVFLALLVLTGSKKEV